MKLILSNGYPFPLPEGFDTDAYDAREFSLTVEGVIHYEYKHTVTVEFGTRKAMEIARQLTGWEVWNDCEQFILEASYSIPDGYDFPAITVRDMAYCGLMLMCEGYGS